MSDILIKFYNSLSGSLEEFIPADDNIVKMYACGPTVYDVPHIGNIRSMIVFDTLYRFLSRVYPEVIYVRNITDVDDKINNIAAQKGVPINQITDSIIKSLDSSLEKLNVLKPTYEPRATAHVEDMIKIIDQLLHNGYAYIAEKHVLYRVRKDITYGVLSKRSLDDMTAGSRVEIAPYKEDPMDFVLWKPSTDEQPSWNSPFGKGRPGWHVECSAMSRKYLGEEFDIHAGGQDLIFPHHENEIAQNYGAFGTQMAHYWIHNGMLQIDGQKMSKTLGNIIRIDQLLEQYDGEVIRYAMLSTHYQKILNWTTTLLQEAKHSLDRLYRALDGDISEQNNVEDEIVVQCLARNLNTPLALKKIHSIADEIFKTNDPILRAKLKKEAEILGLLQKSSWFHSDENIDTNKIKSLIDQRKIAKENKDFKKADEIRSLLTNMGISIEDNKDGTTSWRVN